MSQQINYYRFRHGLVLGIASRVPLVSATNFMLRFHRGPLRNDAAQLFAKFFRVVGIYLRIVPPA